MSSTSRTNGRPALPISRIPALDLDMPATGSAWLVCPDCLCWVEAVRGLVQTHKPDGVRCTGSAQVLAFDLTAAQHAARRQAARIELGTTATVRTGRAALPEGARHTARRTTAHVEQRRADHAVRPTRRARTTMTAAFESAWERVAQVPVAPPASMAARHAA